MLMTSPVLQAYARRGERQPSRLPSEATLGFKAMGIPRDAMTVAEISDAIPPAYSKFIAEKFLEQFAARDAAA